MIHKKKLLKDLIILYESDKKSVIEANDDKEKHYRMGSLITLEAIIQFIEEGNYDVLRWGR